ncbi:MAG: hypothetical protein K8S16_19990 [Bacteroidales bacterium]|nr:hypothetical protein [Bacteroidales bacterium]
MYICNLIIEFIATNKLNIDKLKSEFIDKPIFTTKDIQTFYLTLDPNVTPTTINWRVYKLVQSGIINRVGRGKFKFGMSKIYNPDVSSKMKSIYKKLKKEFPYLKTCIWNSSSLNEFMVHQPGRFYLIVEVEKEATLSAFYFLKEFYQPVFIEPTNDILNKYLPVEKEAIIIKPLVSESPAQNTSGIDTISIEKLLVDVFCDVVVFSAQQGAEMRTIFNEALAKYSVNLDRMLRYASRRRKKDSFQKYLNTIQIYGSKN